MRTRLLIFAILTVLFASPAFAQNATAPKALPPVTMQDGNVFKPQQYALSASYVYFDQDDIRTGTSSDDPGYGKRRRTANASSLMLRAGLFENFEAMLTATYWDKAFERRNIKGATDESSLSGLGDMQVMMRYQIISQQQGAPLSLAMGLGLDIPTGACDKENSFGAQPYFGPFLQLGTGSWNPKGTISATKTFGRSRLDAQLMYTWFTEGRHHFDKGEMFNYNLGYGYALNTYVTLGLSVNGVHQDKNIQELSPGVVGNDPNSGCDMVYIAPEVRCNIAPLNTVLGLALPVTVYADMDGTQPVEDYRVVGKLTFKF